MKHQKKVGTLILVILIISVSVYLLTIKASEESKIIAYAIKDLNKTENQNDLQYHLNTRFEKSLLLYRINPTCQDRQKQRIKKAFNILSNKTILKFYESSRNEDIYITCNKSIQENIKEFIKVGEGRHSLTNTGEFHLIKKGEVSLYKNQHKCKFPNVEVHEILHVLGFKHSTNKQNMMYNVSHCDQEINPEIITKINELYNLKPLPDLTFKNFNSSKETNYLKFDSEILNKGLKISGNIILEAHSKNKKIKSWEIGKLEPGKIKKITLKNFFIGDINKLKLILTTSEQEIDKTNNLKEILL